ncbi:hypothetical protein OAK91_00685 [Planctomycetaceae bacterium]|nr:hypothetical protein [Planctomycetaceae bacterium]
MLLTQIVQLLPMILLSGLGLLMMRSHHRAWGTESEAEVEPFAQKHFSKRYRRRMQASGMLVLLGVLITGGQFIDGEAHPLVFSIYWVVVLLLTFWLILLAMGDALSIAAYSKVAQGELEQQKRSIEAEFQRLKAQQGNGHAQTQNPAKKEHRHSDNE